jgi:hypothetical protein
MSMEILESEEFPTSPMIIARYQEKDRDLQKDNGPLKNSSSMSLRNGQN